MMIPTRERLLLYVDDTEEQRYVMRRMLESDGFTVLEAGTGKAALEALHLYADADPDAAPLPILAVILDVKLPDMSGYEVCRRIKAATATAALPVLQVSASFADPTLRAAGLSGGADAYVAQPVHQAELLSLVNALIRSHMGEKILRFQAEVSRRLSASLDYAETLRTVEQAFVPRFADDVVAYLCEPAEGAVASAGEARLAEPVRAAADQVCKAGASRLVDAQRLVVPLATGSKRLGALIFQLDGDRRSYGPAQIPLAEDLADRSALALENASLYSAQQNTQLALIQSEKLAAAGRLSAAIAHEINNPLESITNLMYLIDTSDEITPTLKGYVQEALSELSRLTHIARQSLGFYRELTGPKQFDLNESVLDTVNIYRKRFEAKHLAIECRFAAGPLELHAVKGEVRQVISNLLVNAYDAMTQDSHLLIETALEPGREGHADEVMLRVTDDGPGIPPEVLRHIFEPFYTTKQGTGTGLGLWVSDTIVHKHGGTLEATSRTEGEGHGASFEMRLPVTAPPADT